jgi:signal transduction histidine kinase
VERERIVVVDDDAGMRRMLARMLEPLGHEVAIAESAAEALALAEQRPVDLVVSDLKMPGMDGLNLLRTLRERGHDSAFILVTAFGELDAVLSARDRYELSNFFVKPIFSQDKFLFDVITALRKRRLELENRRLIAALESANQSLERKVTERTQELSEKNLELTRLSNFRADVLKVLSHELRTPMAILKGHLGLSEGGGERRQSTATMRTAVDRVQEIIDQALALKLGSEPASPEIAPREVDPAALVGEVVERISPLVAHRGITIAWEAGHVQRCRWDATRIGSVIEELLVNAVRASRDGQAIRVRIRPHGQSVEIAVSDQGVGIPPGERARIFEPFVTLGPAERHRSGQFTYRAQGAGLGLAVAKLWVDLHRGEIYVHGNEDGPGTTVVLRLPRDARASVSSSDQEAC